MDEEIKDRERIAKQIVKTSNSIRKKYRALKAGKMKEDIALERHFKPIVEPLKQIVENTVSEKFDVELGENETFFLGEEEEPKPKKRRSNTSFDNSLIPTSTPVKSMLKRSKTVPSNLSETSKILQRKLSNVHMLPPWKKFSKSPMNRSCHPFNTRCKRPRDKKSCRHIMAHWAKIIWE